MGDDELDEASKLKIAANFIKYSPPGQIQKVVEGAPARRPAPICGGACARVNASADRRANARAQTSRCCSGARCRDRRSTA